MDEFLKALNINNEYTIDEKGSAVIDLNNSNDYVRMFNKLDKSDIVEEDIEVSQITLDASMVQYTSDEYSYRISLMADFKGDTYKMVISKD